MFWCIRKYRGDFACGDVSLFLSVYLESISKIRDKKLRRDAVMFHFDDIDRNDVFTGRVLYQFAGSMYILGIWRISGPWNLSGSRADSEIKDVVYEEENTGRLYYGWNIRRH